MNINILTLFPELYSFFLKTSLINKAIDKKIVNINLNNIFDYTTKEKRVDAPVFGHNSGMLIRPDVIENFINSQDSIKKSYKIFFCPKGKKLDQDILKDILLKENVSLFTARYEGIDSRAKDYYSDLNISIGDYILMGGDLPAMVLIEGLIRLLPEAVSSKESIEKESFSGPFLDYSTYTKPVLWNGLKVPEIIRSGDHKKILDWQREDSIKKSISNNFQWLKSHVKDSKDIKDTKDNLISHYVVLMHDHVILDSENIGTSSVTSLDIHDIARSACTYGLKKYFIVTPLADQQKIVQELLNFWLGEKGINYNFSRHQAIKNVSIKSNIKEVIDQIKEIEDKEPLLIATTAKNNKNNISYYDQEKIWAKNRPILFVLGTAKGLSSDFLEKCDYILNPIMGFSDYNHLSVRSAAAVIFDRWLGINLKI